MAEKNIEALITKIVKKVIKKEMAKLNSDNLAIVSSQTNQPLDTFIERVSTWEDDKNTEEMVNDLYSNSYPNLPNQEDAELERKLRELKFKQELRKDWILFLVKDVIVYSVTMLFIFTVAGFYLYTLME